MTAPILSKQRWQVLEIARHWGDEGVTAYNVTRSSRIQQNVAARRLRDLTGMGYVEEAGARPGGTGRLCMAYRITDAGREALR